MSTNYFFRCKENGDEVLNGLKEIHIGQYAAQSCLLMRQDRYYRTVDEMKDFYAANVDFLNIVNDYDEVITWNQLQDRLLSAGPRRGHRYHRDEFNYTWDNVEFS